MKVETYVEMKVIGTSRGGVESYPTTQLWVIKSLLGVTNEDGTWPSVSTTRHGSGQAL